MSGWVVGASVVVAGVTSAVSANQKKQAAKGAVNAQRVAAANNAEAADWYYDRAENNWKQNIKAGDEALTTLQKEAGMNGQLGRQFTAQDFQASPSYEFDKNEQLKALQRSQSGRGGALSGGTMKALLDRSSQIANREFGSREQAFRQWQAQNFGQLFNMSQQGMQAKGQLQGADTNRLNVQTGSNTNAGNAIAAGYTAMGNANAAGVEGVGDAISQGLSMYSAKSDIAKQAGKIKT